MKKRLFVSLACLIIAVLCFGSYRISVNVTMQDEKDKNIGGSASVSMPFVFGKFGESVVTVKCKDGYVLRSITLNDDEVWLVDGKYTIKGLDANAKLNVTFDKVSKNSDALKVTPDAITVAFYDKTAMSYGITWQTVSTGNPILQYVEAKDGMTKENVDFSKAKTVTCYPTNGVDAIKNSGMISGLNYEKTYFYRVGDTSGVYSDVGSIDTRAENFNKFTFFHVSDTQDASYKGSLWAKLLGAAYANDPDAAFIAHTGDMVQEGGSAAYWSSTLNFSKDYLMNTVLMPTSGNHESEPAYLQGFTGAVMKHFTINTPDQNVDYGMYYSFDYGNAHFTVLSNNGTLSDEQLEWLENDLKSTQKQWKIVMMHNPEYSPGKYGAMEKYNGIARGLKRLLNPLFAEYGVDLVLTGHDHVYSKSYPIDSEGDPVIDSEHINEMFRDVEVSYVVNPKGTIHLMSGVGGEQTRGVITPLDPIYAECLEDYADASSSSVSCSAITIDGGTLTVRYYAYNYSTNVYTLKKSWGIIKE